MVLGPISHIHICAAPRPPLPAEQTNEGTDCEEKLRTAKVFISRANAREREVGRGRSRWSLTNKVGFLLQLQQTSGVCISLSLLQNRRRNCIWHPTTLPLSLSFSLQFASSFRITLLPVARSLSLFSSAARATNLILAGKSFCEKSAAVAPSVMRPKSQSIGQQARGGKRRGVVCPSASVVLPVSSVPTREVRPSRQFHPPSSLPSTSTFQSKSQSQITRL